MGDRHVGQQSVLKAALADIVPSQMRAYGFGMFATVFGVFWFVGSATIGLLYDLNVTYLVIFSVAIQLIALPLFIWPWRHREPATA